MVWVDARELPEGFSEGCGCPGEKQHVMLCSELILSQKLF